MNNSQGGLHRQERRDHRHKFIAPITEDLFASGA